MRNIILYGIIGILSILTFISVYIITKKIRIKWIKPLEVRISSGYGWRIHPIYRTRKFHNGVDLSAPEGTPISSPMDGTVIAVWYDERNGNALKIKHINGFTTGYAHNEKIFVKRGDEVKKGDIIANVGNTGASTGAHLHFTLRNELNKFVNPTLYIYKT